MKKQNEFLETLITILVLLAIGWAILSFINR
jgi:hypothetical protein